LQPILRELAGVGCKRDKREGKAMGQAVLTFLGVVLGATIAGGVTVWQARLTIQRDREARQVEREQTRKDTHDAFQRDAILALHEAVTAIGNWRSTRMGSIAPPRPSRERFDDELRGLVEELDGHAEGCSPSRTTKPWRTVTTRWPTSRSGSTPCSGIPTEPR
jgi:hypothetical protein